MNRLKINFVLPATGKTGGVVVVLEYARQLRKMGHDVLIYYPLIPYNVYVPKVVIWKKSLWWFKYILRCLLDSRKGITWFPEQVSIRLVLFITDVFVRSADVVLATAWPTAYSVANLSKSKGEKFYFVQHYENWHGEEVTLDASYRLPLKLLVIAPWLTELIRTKFGREVTAELHNGIDLDFFKPGLAKPDIEHPVILMMYHVLEIKGIEDGLYVLRKIHNLYPNVRIRLFGMYPFNDKAEFMEYFFDPTPEKLLELYQTAHIFLSPSHSEGWHLPPMEAMACGCALVATNVGCIPVLKQEGNLLSANPWDRETLFQHLEFFVTHPDEMKQIAQRGRETILNYGWEEKSRRMEEVFASEISRDRPNSVSR